MLYRAFLAATKKDLEKQREYVTKQLRDAGLAVDPMENWPADAENPAQLSAKRTAGCHFCIALVAFQRGTVAKNDPNGRTITQIEIDTAIKRGLKTLVFLLRDTTANRQDWPHDYSELGDPQLHAWRSQLQSSMVCGYFDADAMPEVMPAVTRQIVQWEARRRRRYLTAAALFLGAVLMTLAGFALSPSFRDWTASRFLAFNDPIVFQDSRDGFYKIARLLEGRSDILDNTKFRDDVRNAAVSFDLFANTFATFRDYAGDFEDLAKHGVRLRFVLTDFGDDNRANWTAFDEATEALPATQEETLANAKNIRVLILDLQRRYPNRVELRLSRKPLFYTLWVRDPETSSGMAHMGVTFYGQKTAWPAIRVSKRTGGDTLASLEDQFELIWREAKPDVATAHK